MSYLASIVARATGAEPALQPRTVSRYESFAPLEESAIESVAATPPSHIETVPVMLPMPAPITHTVERATPHSLSTPIPSHEPHEPSLAPIEPSIIREHERTHEHESRIETQQHEHEHHHHYHTSRQTLLRETNTIVESTKHESNEPPLRALLQPQPIRTIEHLTRENTTTLRESQSPQTPPSIKVTIGRVDVRAIAPAPNAAKSAAPRPKPFTLDDYVRLRDGERR